MLMPNPVWCPELRFLQSLLESKRSHSTLKVYAAAISAQHVKVDNHRGGSHGFVTKEPDH